MRLRATLVLFLLGCAPDAPGETPEATVRAFVEAMERSALDEGARAEAFALLAPASREALGRRARRASHLGRRTLEPWEMIAAGSLRLRAPLDPMEVTVEGDRATVRLRGGAREVVVPLVREEGVEDGPWRLVLEVDSSPDAPSR